MSRHSSGEVSRNVVSCLRLACQYGVHVFEDGTGCVARGVYGAKASAKHEGTSRRGCSMFCYQPALMIDAKLSIDYPRSPSSPDKG